MAKSGTGCKNSACVKANCNDFLCGIAKNPPIFTNYISPNGGLDRCKESHALFYYYLLAQKAVEDMTGEIVYEGHADPEYKHEEIMQSVALFYDVTVEAMLQAWKAVDLTIFMHSLPKLADKYRYKSNITIRSK